MKIRVLILVAILAIASVAGAYDLSGRVVGIADGDTLTVLDASHTQHVIRLAGVDAPENSQAFGQRSKQNLSRLAFGRDVTLDCGKEESYGRLVCKVTLPGGEDVCLDQVKAGMAWHYKQYESEQTPADRKSYADGEDAARLAHAGLWAEDAHPIPPWDFRHRTETKLCFDKEKHRIACNQDYAGPVRGNRRSHIYHWPDCPNYENIGEENRIEFANAAAAQEAGYRAARNCP